MSNPTAWLDRDVNPVNYGEPTYWERRYELDRREFGTSHRHDWYFGFEKLKATIESYFGQPMGQRILITGCGHSAVPSDMHAMGYRCITAVDISTTIVALMQQENQDKEGLEYLVADARKLDAFPDELFDCIFDKGCVDALHCGYRSTEDVLDMCHACCRTLRPGGVFLCVSHGESEARMHSFRHKGLQWTVNAIPIHGSEGLLVYVCTKQSREEIAAGEQRRKEELEHLVSMRTQNKHSVDGRHKGVMPANLIVHARAPHEMDAVNLKLEAEHKAATLATHKAAIMAVENIVAQRREGTQVAQDQILGPSGCVITSDLSTTMETSTVQTGGSSVCTGETEEINPGQAVASG